VSVPLDGGDLSAGQAISIAVRLAVEQANARGGITLGGDIYALQLLVLDDFRPIQAERLEAVRRNANDFVREPNLLGVVGPYNSQVAHTMQPIFNKESLVLISPSNTDPSLTIEDPGVVQWLESHRPEGRDHLTYFRISTTDLTQGAEAAHFLRDDLNKAKISILYEDDTYGQTLAIQVQKGFEALGGNSLGSTLVMTSTDLSSSIANQHPDALFYGGTTANYPAQLGSWMNDYGLKIPLVGGDGIREKVFIEKYVTNDGGGLQEANGIYATLATADVEHLDTGKQFVAEYNQRFCNADLGAYSASAYDATNILIAAIEAAGKPDREAVRQAIANTKNFQGVLGPIGFDAEGDNTQPWVSIYKVENGEWKFLKQVKR
jgi:branched-chain amino acid transport system substrate-binding protein